MTTNNADKKKKGFTQKELIKQATDTLILAELMRIGDILSKTTPSKDYSEKARKSIGQFVTFFEKK